MRARKDKIVSGLVGGIGSLFKSHGVTHLQGFGKLTGPNHIVVTDEHGGETKMKADNIIIATGSRPINIPTFPIDGKRILTSDHLLELGPSPEVDSDYRRGSNRLRMGVHAGATGCRSAYGGNAGPCPADGRYQYLDSFSSGS